ncbi:MAG TPA: DUF4333 domain-containing protein [Solirubrobacterales bacterium]|nr:DUF4333 domain-containing protein [Solirubrobacterales bacterium]
MAPLIAVLVLALTALPLVGCGETVIDGTKTEEQLQASLAKSLNEKVSSVDCPSDQKVEAGATFTCSVKLSDGTTETATLKIRNNEADVSVIDLSATNQRGQ